VSSSRLDVRSDNGVALLHLQPTGQRADEPSTEVS